MTTYADLIAAGLDGRDAAAQIAQETAMQPGEFARTRHVLATRIVEAYDGPDTEEAAVTVAMFTSSLEGIDTMEASGIPAEQWEASTADLVKMADDTVSE